MENQTEDQQQMAFELDQILNSCSSGSQRPSELQLIIEKLKGQVAAFKFISEKINDLGDTADAGLLKTFTKNTFQLSGETDEIYNLCRELAWLHNRQEADELNAGIPF
jgi:hypothetical protein